MTRLIPANTGPALYVPQSWALTSGGTVATMDIDFINDRAWNAGTATTVAALLSCSRAGAGFYTKADNTLVSFSSNVLRYGTNGLLVEEARTNLALQSQTFGTTWGVGGASAVTSDATAAPDGTTTADLFASNSTSASSRALTQFFAFSTLSYTLSVYAKAAGSPVVQLLYPSAAFGTGAYANFDLANGVLGLVGGTTTAVITALANGWYRCSIAATASSAASGTLSFSPKLLPTSARAGPAETITSGDGIYLWGGQLEQAAVRSSYIVTTTASVLRPADLVTFAAVTWLDGTADTLYAEWKAKNVNNANIWAFDATNDKALDEQTGMSARIAGATTATTAAADATVKAAWRMVVNDYAISMNGGTVATDVSETAPGTLTASRLGVDLAGANQLNGYVRRVAAFKSLAAIDAALQTLST